PLPSVRSAPPRPGRTASVRADRAPRRARRRLPPCARTGATARTLMDAPRNFPFHPVRRAGRAPNALPAAATYPHSPRFGLAPRIVRALGTTLPGRFDPLEIGPAGLRAGSALARLPVTPPFGGALRTRME